MKGLLALQIGMMLGSLGRGVSWDEDFVVEKSSIPKREPLPLTVEEELKLSGLNGKAKKKYLKELKAKYE